MNVKSYLLQIEVLQTKINYIERVDEMIERKRSFFNEN